MQGSKSNAPVRIQWRNCENCGPAPHEIPYVYAIVHLLLTVLTGGVWMLVWLIVEFRNQRKPGKCQICGHVDEGGRRMIRKPKGAK